LYRKIIFRKKSQKLFSQIFSRFIFGAKFLYHICIVKKYFSFSLFLRKTQRGDSCSFSDFEFYDFYSSGKLFRNTGYTMNSEIQNCIKDADTEITNRLVKIRQGLYKQNEIIESIGDELEMCFTKLFNFYFDMVRHEKLSKTETKEKTETEAKTESESKSEKPKRKPRAKKVTINETSTVIGECKKSENEVVVLKDATEYIHTHPPKKNGISVKITEDTPGETIEYDKNMTEIDQN
jgi:hypothetical protein